VIHSVLRKSDTIVVALIVVVVTSVVAGACVSCLQIYDREMRKGVCRVKEETKRNVLCKKKAIKKREAEGRKIQITTDGEKQQIKDIIRVCFKTIRGIEFCCDKRKHCFVCFFFQITKIYAYF